MPTTSAAFSSSFSSSFALLSTAPPIIPLHRGAIVAAVDASITAAVAAIVATSWRATSPANVHRVQSDDTRHVLRLLRRSSRGL